MGCILKKTKSKVKGFLGKSKKLVQTPKELPPIPTVPTQLPANAKEQQPPKKPVVAPVQPVPTQQQLPKPAPFKKELKLPKIEPLPAQGEHGAHEEDLRQFEEAISNINIDMVHSEAPAQSSQIQEPGREKTAEYYRPEEIGEGYFSEIEHYIKNKDVNEIIDDVLKKDFLTSMKDYHNTKTQGKPFYLHKHDLKHKLKKKMNQLRGLEQEWHSFKAKITENEDKKKEIESKIDQESQELKELFKQVKISHILEQEAPKEHYFRLQNGQKLKSLNDLRKALEYMPDKEFRHHVDENNNDFASWVEEALQNQEISEKIKKAKTKDELQEVLKNPF